MPCIIECCLKPVRYKKKSLCNMHYNRIAKFGRSYNICREAGTGSFTKRGYHIISINGKQMLAHRHIMEQHLNRKLGRTEVVHHINGNPSDNSIENLIVITQGIHAKIHNKGRKNPPISKQHRKRLSIAGKKRVTPEFIEFHRKVAKKQNNARDPISGKFTHIVHKTF